MFKVDHSQVKEFEAIKPGEYEVTVVNYELKKAQSGNNRVVVDYEIRSDVEQPCQGQKILFDNFTVADNTMWRFQAASKAAQFPDGIQFGSFKEWADAFLNKHLRVSVALNNNGYPEVKSLKASQASAPVISVPVNDSDVPF
ncbi:MULTISPECIES: DUF669 domain-containing protein [Bacillus cereus group]|uniref:DUF669 domain-containing protein n=1 Tax=Bacillus cereus group TaxID=86661 RepID=UPI000BF0F628|nr:MULTISPECIES: DUF669 domain-containing protein [Bacillus cereus group]PEK83555.1 hypothetical protein CN594_19945 [Bacillus toyonensis]PEO34043.1 hypothetical protein CN569_12155 [Bacillus toyonensis]PFR63908.1 hypothetical protein COK36_01430 [Bacillus cereus]PFY29605.1 hypothetical protein COL54_33455 [Bacillus toyonensis]PFY35533.1 hypothetical protein COL55_31045 [Bacillus toyonensis]